MRKEAIRDAEVQNPCLTLPAHLGLSPVFTIRSHTVSRESRLFPAGEPLVELVFPLALSCDLYHSALWRCWTVAGRIQESWPHLHCLAWGCLVLNIQLRYAKKANCETVTAAQVLHEKCSTRI